MFALRDADYDPKGIFGCDSNIFSKSLVENHHQRFT